MCVQAIEYSKCVSDTSSVMTCAWSRGHHGTSPWSVLPSGGGVCVCSCLPVS